MTTGSNADRMPCVCVCVCWGFRVAELEHTRRELREARAQSHREAAATAAEEAAEEAQRQVAEALSAKHAAELAAAVAHEETAALRVQVGEPRSRSPYLSPHPNPGDGGVESNAAEA